MNVYQAINAVQADLCALGISKDQKNSAQGFNFRGIDQVYNALAPLLARHQLVVLPKVQARECVERITPKGTALFYVTVDVIYTFASAEDGSTVDVRSFGEAMDTGDKATNKAMSAAYKYACFQTFCIPTEAQDADAQTHEVEAMIAKLRKTADYIKDGIARDDELAVLEAWGETTDAEKELLWRAITKGGYFTQDEKKFIHAAKHKAYAATTGEAA